MFRVRTIELACVALLAATGPVSAQQDVRSNFWIGTHLFGADQYAPVLKNAVGLRLSLLETEIDMNDDLRRYYRAHRVEIDDAIGTLTADLETKYGLSADKALMVMSGFGTGDPSDMLSAVYVGPPTNKFEVELARARLLSNSEQPAAQMYTSLLFLYAMIKEADTKGMDYQTIIAPLREKALSLTLQAQDADQQSVARIKYNLEALTPP